ncbi:MAG TPA: HlyD family efflux transporter periplasmic adaptor subunit [Saprospiraceae bacterium]|nr:HlyD family efflux transporter periplasmic adaptor subunit [Saprospiraceae bacterium]
MDRKIEKKIWTWKRILLLLGGIVIISLIVYNFAFADNRATLRTQRDRLTIGTVTYGEFQDFIPVTGNIEPAQTFYLDAIEGGSIKRMVRQSGTHLRIGDTIVVLTNSSLQLDVMQRETQLYEQINNLRQTRLLLDQNDLNQQAQLAEIDYQINLFRPQYQRFQKLLSDSLISQREFEEVKEQYEYNLQRKNLTYRSYRNDSLARVIQLQQLKSSEERMLKSLEAVGNILDNLVVRAPISGQLAAPQLEIGQSIIPGQRLGQIDVLGQYLVRVGIDEIYLPRIVEGLEGKFTLSGIEYRLNISKIYPTIEAGRFEVDMIFPGEIPPGIRRGQTVRIRLELGNSEQRLLLPVGGFYKDTGGNWVFVLAEGSDTKAEKRNIRIGRRNPDYYEILDGLDKGDRVIISSYENFGRNEVLILQ